MYNKRTWLNKDESDSTGSVVAFDGEVTDLDTGKKYKQRFLEVSDCRYKVRLHQTSDDSLSDFIDKIRLLKNEVDSFFNHLNSSICSGSAVTAVRFKAKDIIKTNNKFYECVCADNSMATFGEITKWDEEDKRVSYEKIFIVSQIMQDDFRYELVNHHSVRVMPNEDGGVIMGDILISILEKVQNGSMSVDKANSLIKEYLRLDFLNAEQIKRVSKMLNDVSKEAFIEAGGSIKDYKKWWRERKKLNLNIKKEL